MLTKVFLHVKDQKRGHIPWQLNGLPELKFYSEMHKFLHKWPLTRSASKATIGRLYMAIDKNLQIKGQTPNNTYLFKDRMVKSHHQCDVSMTIDNILPMDWKLISATCHHPCFAPPYTRNG